MRRSPIVFWSLGLVIGSLTIVSSCTSPTTVRLHPDFVTSPDRIQTVAILPPECQVMYLELSGDDHRLTTREQELDSLFLQLIPRILRSQHYELRTFTFPPDSHIAMEYRFILEQLRRTYGETLKEMYPNERVTMNTVTNYPGKIGPVVNQLAEYAAVDALLFIQYSGFQKSPELLGDEIVLGVLMGVATGIFPISNAKGGRLQAALIDGTTGNILWHNYAVEAAPVEQLIEQIFEQFPNNNEALQHYVKTGTAISHPFAVETFQADTTWDSSVSFDYIVLQDGREFFGEIIDITEFRVMLGQRRTVYLINREKIDKILIDGESVSMSRVEHMDLPRYNFSGFEKRIEIY